MIIFGTTTTASIPLQKNLLSVAPKCLHCLCFKRIRVNRSHRQTNGSQKGETMFLHFPILYCLTSTRILSYYLHQIKVYLYLTYIICHISIKSFVRKISLQANIIRLNSILRNLLSSKIIYDTQQSPKIKLRNNLKLIFNKTNITKVTVVKRKHH